MKLYLASLSQQIQTLCEEVFRDIPSQEWTLCLANGSVPECDLYLWDVDHAMADSRAYRRMTLGGTFS